jgi:GNAT superfamily N-acetyltransferase
VTFDLEPFDSHDVEFFDCGNDELNGWLRRAARDAAGHGTRVFVLVDRGSGDTERIIGYFALAPHYVDRDQVSARLGRGAPARIPAILLAKFAIDSSMQGQGLGSDLLIEALLITLEAARRAGGRVVVVDAIDEEAAAFYLHHDFDPLPGNPHRLLLRLSNAAKALGVAWP